MRIALGVEDYVEGLKLNELRKVEFEDETELCTVELMGDQSFPCSRVMYYGFYAKEPMDGINSRSCGD